MANLRDLPLNCTDFIRLSLLIILMMCSSFSQADSIRVLVLGDSISAGYGIEKERAWVNLLHQRLESKGMCKQGCKVVNASVSGSTTEDGANRISALIKRHQPTTVILELGGNDGLRGYSLKSMKQNLIDIINKVQKSGANVLMLGMEIPPNYGKRYTEKFRQVFAAVAKETRVDWIPFLLETVATDKRYMQDDGIHPNALAQPILLDGVWPALTQLMTSTQEANNKAPSQKISTPEAPVQKDAPLNGRT